MVVTHQHAGSSGCLKYIVNAFDPECAAFFVVHGTNIAGDVFGLLSCHVIQVIRVIICRPEV